MTLHSGERQVAPTVDGIRRDHVARYEWAASVLPPDSYVIDAGCGIGYGARILADAGHRVLAIDDDEESIAYAQEHYAHERIQFLAGAIESFNLPAADAAVCFEMIEHIEDPLPMLRDLRGATRTLLASVPNEDVFPWKNYAFHFRHYTKGEFEQMLADAGFAAGSWCGQGGPESPVELGVNGRTLIAVASAKQAVPAKHIAILGLGPSVRQFLELAKRNGGRRAICDEVWGINALGDVFACDRIFHMDDVRIQEIRAAAKPDSNIAYMLKWLKTTKTPVITSRAHPDYPAMQEFPLDEVITKFPMAYFNSTAAYAVAHALHEGATKISCWGFDYTYPDVHDAEKGRACVEFWLGMAAERKVEIMLPRTTSLLDAIYPQAERFYGYDTLNLEFKRDGDGITVSRTERDTLPTAEEIEAAYCHKSFGDKQRESVEKAN